MTVVAWDGRTLAADGLVLDEHSHIEQRDFIKIYHWPRSRAGIVAAGFAGCPHVGMALVAWVAGGCRGKAPEVGTGTDFMAIDRSGIVWTLDSAATFAEFNRDPYAIGSGKTYATAAMSCGVDAIGAIRVATRFNAGVGGVGYYYRPETREAGRFSCAEQPTAVIEERVHKHLRSVK